MALVRRVDQRPNHKTSGQTNIIGLGSPTVTPGHHNCHSIKTTAELIADFQILKTQFETQIRIHLCLLDGARALQQQAERDCLTVAEWTSSARTRMSIVETEFAERERLASRASEVMQIVSLLFEQEADRTAK